MRRSKRLLEVDFVEDAAQPSSSARVCLFCPRQHGSVDNGAPANKPARIVLTDGIDDACFVVWVVLFRKKFTAADTLHVMSSMQLLEFVLCGVCCVCVMTVMHTLHWSVRNLVCLPRRIWLSSSSLSTR